MDVCRVPNLDDHVVRTVFRAVPFAFGVLSFSVLVAFSHAAASEPSVVFQGVIALPDQAEDAEGNTVQITGLSGIAWLHEDRYVAVMDNSRHLLLFRMSLAPTGNPTAVTSLRVVKLAQRHDYEDVVPCPGIVVRGLLQDRGRTGRDAFDEGESAVLVSEEDTPAVRAFSLGDGRMLGALPLPGNLLTRRANRGLESLAIEPGGRGLWTANEEALPADGPAASVGGGTVVRLTRLALTNAEKPPPFERLRSRREPPAAKAFQAAYPVDPPHTFVRVLAGEPLSGLSALVALGNGQLLTLERSGAPGLPPFANRIYLIDTQHAVDVSAVERDLAERQDSFVKKRLLWSDSLGLNLEGLCLGPSLADGNRSLVAIADNGGIGTPNQIVGLALIAPPPLVRNP